MLDALDESGDVAEGVSVGYLNSAAASFPAEVFQPVHGGFRAWGKVEIYRVAYVPVEAVEGFDDVLNTVFIRCPPNIFDSGK